MTFLKEWIICNIYYPFILFILYEKKKYIFLSQNKNQQDYRFNKNIIKNENINNNIIITDRNFINECLLLSEYKVDSSNLIVDKIANFFGCKINYHIVTKNPNKLFCIVKLNKKDLLNFESDIFSNIEEAKLNVNKKIIMKFLEEEYANKIVTNLENNIKNYLINNNPKTFYYSNFLINNQEIQLINRKKTIIKIIF